MKWSASGAFTGSKVEPATPVGLCVVVKEGVVLLVVGYCVSELDGGNASLLQAISVNIITNIIKVSG